MLSQPEEDGSLVFFREPREKLVVEESVYVSRLPDKDARLVSLYDAMRPLYQLNNLQGAAVFILMNYFGASQNEVSKILGIKGRRVYAIIQRNKESLASIQAGADVQEPGRDN